LFPYDTSNIGKISITSPVPLSYIANNATVLNSIGTRILHFSFGIPSDPKEPLRAYNGSNF
jgi:hypothetical protein